MTEYVEKTKYFKRRRSTPCAKCKKPVWTLLPEGAVPREKIWCRTCWKLVKQEVLHALVTDR